MPKVRFLVTQTGDNQFKQLKKSGTMITLSYAFHGQDMDGVAIAATVTGPKEAMKKMFSAWPIAVAEHFLVDVNSDPVTVAQLLAAQAQTQATAGQKPPAKVKTTKPAKQPGGGVAGTTPAGQGQTPQTPKMGASAGSNENENEGKDSLETLAKETDQMMQEQEAKEGDEAEEDSTEEEQPAEEDS